MLTTLTVEKEATAMTHPTTTVTGFTPPATIPVAMGPKLRSGAQIISGYMPAGALIPDNYEIPAFDPRTGKGYQRPSQDSRVNELATDLRRARVDLPTSILLNLRSRDARHAVGDGKLNLEMLRGNSNLTAPFYVVDGQHRVLALRKLIDDPDSGLSKWGAFLIPFVCMVGATEAEEMEQFYVINSRAKPVRTDLALALLRKLTDHDAKMLERLEEKGRDWQVAAEKLVEDMAESSSVWHGRIRLAAMEKAETTIPSASMVTSLKPLLSYAFFARLSFDQQLKVLDTFWRGLREVMRPAFDDPTEHVIQKGVGVIVMHTILLDVLEIVRAEGKSAVDPAAYSDIMRGPIEDLQGEAQDGIGTPVKGVDFWRVAPHGAAGSYSSSAGRRVLIARIRNLLRHVETI